jgi:hypothetical protein
MDKPRHDYIGRFDQVRILTSKNVYYISTQDNQQPVPTGEWNVVALLPGDNLMLSKNLTIICLPSADVFKVVDYTESLTKLKNTFGDLLNHGEREKESGSG